MSNERKAMTIHDRTLQEAYQAWMAKPNPSAHLDEAAWERLATNELAEAERDALLGHVFACAECSEVWKGVLALNRDAEDEGLIERQDRAPRSLWRSRFMPLALAATVVLAVGGVLMIRQPAPTETARGTATLAAVDGLMMAYSTQNIPMFVWTPVPEATGYRIELFTEDGRPYWSAEVTAPPTPWPAELPRVKGAYRWRVEAIGSGGPVARSRLMPLEIAR